MTLPALCSREPWGLRSQPPMSCGSQGFIPFPLHDKQPIVLGQALPTEQRCWGAADPSEAGRNVPEHNICKSCLIGIFPTRSDYQISFCHICKWIGWGCKTKCLGAWPSVKTVLKAQFGITVTRWLFWFFLALTGSRSWSDEMHDKNCLMFINSEQFRVKNQKDSMTNQVNTFSSQPENWLSQGIFPSAQFHSELVK